MKYPRSTKICCKNKEIKKSEFVAETSLQSNQVPGLWSVIQRDKQTNIQTDKQLWNSLKRSWGTQRCPGYKKLLPPFTRTWSILPENSIFAFKVDPLDLESLNQDKNIPEFPNQHVRKIGPWVPELWLDKQTDRHPVRRTNRDYNFVYIDVEAKKRFSVSLFSEVIFTEKNHSLK